MHRGSATVKPGDPIWMIECIYAEGTPQQYSMCKPFASLSGFKAGLRAVKDDIGRHRQHGWGPTRYNAYILPNPHWQPCDDLGRP